MHVRTCARADVPPFPYLGDGLTDCAEIWYAVRDLLDKHFKRVPLAKRFTEVDGGVHVHARTPLSISQELPDRLR